MITLKNKLQDNELTSLELRKNCIITQVSNDDFEDIAQILYKTMNLPSVILAKKQIKQCEVIFEESVKIIDERTNEIYGVLLLSKMNLLEGTPLLVYDALASSLLQQCSHINGFLFIIDERLRGYNYDKEMIKSVLPFIQKFDLLWVGVDTSLKTHNYWKRIGLYPLLTLKDVIFYCKILNKKVLENIYNYIKSNKT